MTPTCARRARARGRNDPFRVIRAGRPPLAVALNLPGLHNVRNALAAIAVATELEVEDAAIQRALAGFEGIGRRLEVMGEVATRAGRVTLVDDYGHHPTEIEATLDAVRQAWPGRRLVLAFQPHRYTRTRDLIDDFGRVLSAADVLLVTEVYAAGEEPIANADGRAICRAVRGRGRLEPVFVEDVRELPAALAGVIADRDVVLTMGAGSIGAVAHELPAALGVTSARARAMSRFAIARDSWIACSATSRCRGTRPGTSAVRPTPGSRRATSRTCPPSCVRCRPRSRSPGSGLGSNLLVRDGGIRGVVISVHGILNALERVGRGPRARRGRRAVRAARPSVRQVAARARRTSSPASRARSAARWR